MSLSVDLISVPDAPRPFRIGRHPITMAKYWDFLDDTGWRRPRHWPSARSASSERMPVSWVNHFDANAYCYWLSLQAGQRLFLPTTDMLRSAARSAESIAQLAKESREAADRVPYRPQGMHYIMIAAAIRPLQESIFSQFPWGDKPDAKRCNCKEFRPHRPGPTPVDSFGELGRSGYGVEDISGNLWEMASTVKTADGQVISFTGSFFDPEGTYPEAMHFTGTWPTTLATVTGQLENTQFGWDLRFDLFGGSYGTAAADCRTDQATAWTSAANFGPYAGFRVAAYLLSITFRERKNARRRGRRGHRVWC